MPLTPLTQAIIEAFGAKYQVKPERLKNLRRAIEAAPALVAQINEAAAKEQLKNIAPLSDPHAAGVYREHPRELQIPLQALDASPGGRFTGAAIIFILGHELQHALDREAMAQTMDRLLHDTAAIAKESFQHEHDYTATVATYLASMRQLEAKAEISAWNAAVSAQSSKPAKGDAQPPSLEAIYTWRPGLMRKFIEVDRSRYPATYSLKTGFEVDARQYMAMSEHNLEGMGRNYVDCSSGLGRHGNSNYANYYGARAITCAVRAERHAHPHGPDHGIRIDMAALKLSPCSLADNGIDFGGNTAPMPYVDRSFDPPRRDLLRHTVHSHRCRPKPPPPSPGHSPPSIEERRHPDNALYHATLIAVRRMHEQLGTPLLQCDTNLAAALVVSARRDGMSAIHRVMPLGESILGVQDPPMKNTTIVHRKTAEGTSIRSSSHELEVWRRQQEPHENHPRPDPPDPALRPSRRM